MPPGLKKQEGYPIAEPPLAVICMVLVAAAAVSGKADTRGNQHLRRGLDRVERGADFTIS